jgi:hypothetical protein
MATANFLDVGMATRFLRTGAHLIRGTGRSTRQVYILPPSAAKTCSNRRDFCSAASHIRNPVRPARGKFIPARPDRRQAAADWSGGTGTFWAWGAFDGASVTLEASPDGENWFAVGTSLQFGEKGVGAFALGPCKLRATLSGAGVATSVSARL